MRWHQKGQKKVELPLQGPITNKASEVVEITTRRAFKKLMVLLYLITSTETFLTTFNLVTSMFSTGKTLLR